MVSYAQDKSQVDIYAVSSPPFCFKTTMDGEGWQSLKSILSSLLIHNQYEKYHLSAFALTVKLALTLLLETFHTANCMSYSLT